MTINLQSGLALPECEGRLQRFLRQEYELYDGVLVAQDCNIGIQEIVLSVMMNSMLNAQRAAALYHKGSDLSRFLEQIPSAIQLTDNDVPWEPLKELFETACETKGVKISVASKVFHKKRPRLIVMLDSVLQEYYRIITPLDSRRGETWGSKAVEGMKLFREDLRGALPQVQELLGRLAVEGRLLTSVRCLEVLVWMEKEQKGRFR